MVENGGQVQEGSIEASNIGKKGTPFQVCLACSRYNQKYLCNSSSWTFLSNPPTTGISYRPQHVLSHKGTRQHLVEPEKGEISVKEEHQSKNAQNKPANSRRDRTVANSLLL